MSRTRRKSYYKTGKHVGIGEFTEEYRIRQERGLNKNSIADEELREEIWQPKRKKSFKKQRAKKDRKSIKEKLRSY